MGSIEIRPATEADAPSISQVHYDALQLFHDFYAGFFVNDPRDTIPKANLAALKNPNNIFLVAVDTASGSVVGFIRYSLIDAKPAAEADAPEPADEAQPEGVPSLATLFAAKEHLKPVWERFCAREDEMDTCYEEAAKGRKHYYVKHIMIDPAHQRKGIGGRLLKKVTTASDAEQLPAFLVASAEAHGLYARLGFEDLGMFTIDNGYWARELEAQERELGMEGNAGLAEKYDGLMEKERYMVRWPRLVGK